MIITVLAFLFVFAVIVLAHEFGHFISAKKFGVRVDEFAFGFPPKIWSKKKGETRYAINAIPLGGYVKLLGEDGSKDKNPRNLNNKPAWQKTIIFASGVAMNFLLAWVLLSGFYAFGGQAVIDGAWDHKEVINNQKVKIVEVDEESPAAKSGVKSGDFIVKINDKSVYQTGAVFSEVQSSSKNNSEIPFVIESSGDLKEINLKTYKTKIDVNGEQVEIERIGVTMEVDGKIRTVWYQAPFVAFKEMFRIVEMSVTGLFDFLKTLFTTFKISNEVGGPIAIAQVTGAAAKMGFAALIQTIIILSIVLGVFNILPFPALDGGHILFVGIEKVTGKEVPPQIKNIVNLIGFGLLLLLIISVTFKDVARLNVF